MKRGPSKTDFRPLFEPESVAHVGASNRSVAGRFNFTKYMIHMNYRGRLYPVNPKYKELYDLPCYPSLAEVPGPVDVAILAVPAHRCVDVLRDVPAGKLKFVVIHTSGFREIDRAGLEEEILAMAREKGFRVVGPNCMGIYSQRGRIGFWRDHWEIVDRPGTIGFITQSGGHAVNLMLSGMDSGLFFNKVISLGNQLDVSINEILEHMGEDDSIGVIGMYVEDVKDGRRYLELLKEIAPRKPVVVWKGGITEEGKAATVSHTGSMAGNERIFQAALRQSGAIGVDHMQEMIRMLRVLQPPIPLPGGRLAIFSPGGGNTVNICDLFTACPHIQLPRFETATVESLKSLLPEENVDVRNPVDPGATGLLVMDKLIKVVARDSRIDTIILLLTADYLSNIKTEENRILSLEVISTTLSRLSEKQGKTLYVLLRQERQYHEDFDRYRRIMVGKLIEKQIPWVDGSFKEAAAIFDKLAAYHLFRSTRTTGTAEATTAA